MVVHEIMSRHQRNSKRVCLERTNESMRTTTGSTIQQGQILCSSDVKFLDTEMLLLNLFVIVQISCRPRILKPCVSRDRPAPLLRTPSLHQSSSTTRAPSVSRAMIHPPRSPSNRQTREDNSRLTTESIQGSSLSLQSIHHIQTRDGLPLGVFSVRDRISDHRLEERLQHTSGLLVDHGRNTLDTASARETTDGGFSDALDVVAEDLTVTLCTAFAEPFAAFAA